MEKEMYGKLLKEGNLSFKSLDKLLDFLKNSGMKIEEIQENLLRKQKITKHLSRLNLYFCRGNRSWEGLIVGFPGTSEDLSVKNVGTPYLRKILYPILDLHRSLKDYKKVRMPCLYLLGRRFNDVFLRKFRFFTSLIPHVIVLTEDIKNCAARNIEKATKIAKPVVHEYYLQRKLCDRMLSKKGLEIPLEKKAPIKLGLLSYEVPTVEGTDNPERLDILGYDVNDHSLVAFEIKGPHAGRVELENLFLQGMEHRNWLEENKMAVKFAFDKPSGTRIHVRKRVKLVLGFCGDKIPDLFYELKKQARRKDRHLEVVFCRLIPPSDYGGRVRLGTF